MKKTFATGLLGLSLLAGAPAFAADAAVNAPKSPIEQFTGEYWIQSTPENKEAYLFGIESAVEVEKAIAERKGASKATKRDRKGTYTLSPFERGWMKAFPDTPRKEIASEVDAWYKANQDQLNRPVMDVLWYEVIEPRLGVARK